LVENNTLISLIGAFPTNLQQNNYKFILKAPKALANQGINEEIKAKQFV